MRKALFILVQSIVLVTLLFTLTACSDDSDNIVQGYIEGELVYIASSQSGNLVDLLVQRGATVKAKQKLFTLDVQPETDQLAQAKHQLESAQASLIDMQLGERPEEITELKAQIDATEAAINYYQAETKRYKDLSNLDFASQSDYDETLYEFQNSSANLKDLQAQLALAYQGQRENQIKAQEKLVAQYQAQVAEAQWRLDQKAQIAETGGFVFDTYYWPGEWVTAGQPLLAIQAPEYIRVIFFVSEAQLGQIQIGDTVAFQCDSCKNPTLAKISYIANQNEYTPPVIYSEDMRGKLVYEVKATINKAEALNFHPGQPVDVALNGSF